MHAVLWMCVGFCQCVLCCFDVRWVALMLTFLKVYSLLLQFETRKLQRKYSFGCTLLKQNIYGLGIKYVIIYRDVWKL